MTLLMRSRDRHPPISDRRAPQARKKIESAIPLLKMHAIPTASPDLGLPHPGLRETGRRSRAPPGEIYPARHMEAVKRVLHPVRPATG
jgi:hypothetical protein